MRREESLKACLGVRGVLSQGIALTVIGTIIGLAVAFAVTRAMSSLLVGVRATDLLTFAGASLLLGGFSVLSTYLPARRAAKMEPVVALRTE